MTPGIVKIGWFSSHLLPDLNYPYTDIDFVPEAEFVELTEVGRVQETINFTGPWPSVKSKLTFKSTDDIPTDRPVAFYFMDADYNHYILGNCPPHCGTLEKTAEINAPAGQASVNSYEFNIMIAKYKYPKEVASDNPIPDIDELS